MSRKVELTEERAWAAEAMSQLSPVFQEKLLTLIGRAEMWNGIILTLRDDVSRLTADRDHVKDSLMILGQAANRLASERDEALMTLSEYRARNRGE